MESDEGHESDAGCNDEDEQENQLVPLVEAASEGDTKAVAQLLATDGVDVNAATASGDTALIRAAHRGHIEVVRMLLIAEGINVNAANEEGGTALLLAAARGRTEVCTLLLSDEAVDVSAVDEYGRPALTCAVNGGHAEVVAVLLTLAADRIDVNAADDDGQTATRRRKDPRNATRQNTDRHQRTDQRRRSNDLAGVAIVSKGGQCAQS